MSIQTLHFTFQDTVLFPKGHKIGWREEFPVISQRTPGPEQSNSSSCVRYTSFMETPTRRANNGFVGLNRTLCHLTGRTRWLAGNQEAGTHQPNTHIVLRDVALHIRDSYTRLQGTRPHRPDPKTKSFEAGFLQMKSAVTRANTAWLEALDSTFHNPVPCPTGISTWPMAYGLTCRSQ